MKVKAIFLAALIGTLASHAFAEEPMTSPARDAVDDYLGKMGDLSGTPEERGARIHDRAVDDRLEMIEKQEGDAARLREERIYREQHKY